MEVTQHNFTALHSLGSSLQPISNYKDFGTETVGLKIPTQTQTWPKVSRLNALLSSKSFWIQQSPPF